MERLEQLSKLEDRISTSTEQFTIEELKEVLELLKNEENHDRLLNATNYLAEQQGIVMAVKHILTLYKTLKINTLKNQRVLDLGCGSFSYNARNIWYPYFACLCALDGAIVVGIDLNPNTNLKDIPYIHLKADIGQLINEEKLHQILENPTIIRANRFLDSPERHETSPDSVEAIDDELEFLIFHMLSNKGILLCDTGFHIFTSNTLSQIQQFRAVGYIKEGSNKVYIDKKGNPITPES